VTCVEEGIAARKLAPEAEILVISGPWLGQSRAMLEHRLTPVVWESFHLEELAAAARELGRGEVRVHLELDTGMSRQGVSVQDLTAVLQCFKPGSPLRLDGLMTHFSAPEDFDSPETERQLALLGRAVKEAKAAGLRPKWLHAGNSASLLRGQHLEQLSKLAATLGSRLMVRPGLALYGVLPRFSPEELADLADLEDARSALKPVLSWKTRVAGLRRIPAGASAGYNSRFVAMRETTLAMLPMGYADGLRRGVGSGLKLLARGELVPIAGSISMDQTLLEVTDVAGIEIGDEVVLVGEQGGRVLSLYDHSDALGTIPWEISCGIAARVPRIAAE
jgi:alanine racemase